MLLGISITLRKFSRKFLTLITDRSISAFVWSMYAWSVNGDLLLHVQGGQNTGPFLKLVTSVSDDIELCSIYQNVSLLYRE